MLSGEGVVSGDEPMATDLNAPITDACGSHCGTGPVGKVSVTRHCECPDCHGKV